MLPLKTLRLYAVVPLLLVFICDRTIVKGNQVGALKRYEFGSPNYKLPPGELVGGRDPWAKYMPKPVRPRRQLFPTHHDPFSSFFQSMSEGAKVVKHVITDPFRRPKRLLITQPKYIRGTSYAGLKSYYKPDADLKSFYKPDDFKPDFSATTEIKGLSDFPNHDTHTEEHYHYDDTGKRIPPPPGFEFPSTLSEMQSSDSFASYATSEKPSLVPENILRQIEKQEEQKAEDAMISEFKQSFKETKPKHLFTIKTTYKSPFDLAGENGWIPMESSVKSTLNGFKGFSGFDDLKASGGEMTQSFPVSSLHTDVMQLPIGKQVQYEKRIIPIKDFVMKEIIDKDTKKPKYTVYQFTKPSSSSPTIKPLKEVFGDVASGSFLFSSLDNTEKKKTVSTLAPIVIDTTENEIIVSPSPTPSAWRPSPSVSVENYSVSSTWSSPTTRAPARSSTRSPPTRTPTRTPSRSVTTTERPNYPEFFFETVHSDSGSSRKRQKERRQKNKSSAPVDDIFKGSYSHYPTPTKFKPIEGSKLQSETETLKPVVEIKEEEKIIPSSTQDPLQDGFVKYHVHENPSDSLVELEKPIKMKEHKKYSMKKLQASAVPFINIQPKMPSPSPVSSPAPPAFLMEKKRTSTTPHTPVKVDFETAVEKSRRAPSSSYSYSSLSKPQAQESRKRQRPHAHFRDSSVSASTNMERAAGRGSVKYGDKLR
ncbi:uncharacterized protein LOC129794077 [Lutzomyia longipalpis]|uniref:uncharacterized protein LOC129794077 n=1 Tax=Lutzomyia longipalpis TaxID=7200 RepID=UPI0024833B3F|nr:uncharacterized protein LOC129794077 [Lutzomyia longipalpis]